MLYASHPRLDSTVGWSPKQVERVFGRQLDLVWEQRGDDVALGAPASWYRLWKSEQPDAAGSASPFSRRD